MKNILFALALAPVLLLLTHCSDDHVKGLAIYNFYTAHQHEIDRIFDHIKAGPELEFMVYPPMGKTHNTIILLTGDTYVELTEPEIDSLFPDSRIKHFSLPDYCLSIGKYPFFATMDISSEVADLPELQGVTFELLHQYPFNYNKAADFSPADSGSAPRYQGESLSETEAPRYEIGKLGDDLEYWLPIE